jgi:hypothetical protein
MGLGVSQPAQDSTPMTASMRFFIVPASNGLMM